MFNEDTPHNADEQLPFVKKATPHEEEIESTYERLIRLKEQARKTREEADALTPEGMTRLEKRFWSKVDIIDDDDSCWEWTASRRPVQGEEYGHFRWTNPSTKKNEVASAHRVSFFLTNGTLPEVGRHTCDNPPCVRPSHILTGTVADNNRDRDERGRRGYRDQRGTKNAQSILTDEIVVEARDLAREGKSYREVSEALSVKESAIRQAIMGRSWTHLNEISPPVTRSVKGGGRITPEQKVEIRHLRKSGMSCKDIAAQYGCTPSNVSVITRDY